MFAISFFLFSGGLSLKKVFQRWTGQTWTYKIHYNEIKPTELVTENLELKRMKEQINKKLEDVLNQSALEKKRARSLAKQTNKIAKKLVKKSQGIKIRKRKRYSQLSGRQQQRVIHDITITSKNNLAFLGFADFIATKVDIFDQITGLTKSINLLNEAEQNCVDSTRTEEVNNNELEHLHSIMWAKDANNVSDASYRELSSLCSTMPRLWKVQERISEINKEWKIKPLPNNIPGVQHSISDLVTERYKSLCKSGTPPNQLNIKLSGDGTNVGRKNTFVVVSLTILEEGQKAKTSKGNHILAIIKGKEDYQTLQTALEDIRTDIKNVNNINVNGKCIPIQYYLGGDYKFILTALGLDAACCTYACAWCHVHKLQRYSTTIYPSRTIDEIQASAKSKRKEHNASRLPLFPDIPINRVVVDTLHLFLRISDILLHQLALECRRQDASVKKGSHVLRFEQFVQTTCSSRFTLEFENGSIKGRDLQGPEKIKLMKSINVPYLLPSYQYKDKVQSIWETFWLLNKKLRADVWTEQDIQIYEKELKAWLSQFLEVYPAKNVTPYMHVFVMHVPQMLKEHGSISKFTQQGLERLNSECKTIWFSGTNLGKAAVSQLMFKLKRQQYYIDNEYDRKRRKYHCSKCMTSGHSCLSCRED